MMTFNIKAVAKVFLLSAVFTSSSCKKYLEQKEDPSNVTADTYFTQPGHADAAIAAAYAQTRFIGGGAGIFVQNFSLPEMLSGMARTETGQNSDLNNIVGLSFNGDNLLITQWWSGLYSVIAQSNLVLQKVPGITPMDETAKKRILAQAQFLRAWAYFYLVQMWGDVPLVIEPVESFTSENLFPARTAAASIYDQIVADLIAAEGGSLPWTDNTGRASMGAVKGLLAKVYLTMAGFPLSKGATHYKLAADKANEVITNGSFSLFANYDQLHSYATKNRQEHMFMIQYLGGVADNPFQGQIVPNFKDISSLGTEVGSNVPVPNFVATYEAGDERTKDRVGFYYTSYYTEGNLNPLKQLGNPYIYKHFDIISNGTLGTRGTNVSSLNYPLLRYAEVLLIFAEAQNEVDAAPSPAAWNAYKLIRDRAKLVTPAVGTYSKASFRDAVLRERWWELSFECITWYDMLRTRKGFNLTSKNFEPLVGYKLPDNGATVLEKHLLLPLPAAEMRNNPNLRPNNPGY